MALDSLNSSNLEQLALKGLRTDLRPRTSLIFMISASLLLHLTGDSECRCRKATTDNSCGRPVVVVVERTD